MTRFSFTENEEGGDGEGGRGEGGTERPLCSIKNPSCEDESHYSWTQTFLCVRVDSSEIRFSGGSRPLSRTPIGRDLRRQWDSTLYSVQGDTCRECGGYVKTLRFVSWCYGTLGLVMRPGHPFHPSSGRRPLSLLAFKSWLLGVERDELIEVSGLRV